MTERGVFRKPVWLHTTFCIITIY